MSDASIPVSLTRSVRARAGDVCEYCRLPQAMQEATFHVDHVRPRAADGKTTLRNLALACVACALRKGARTLGHDAITRTDVPLFNPRQDQWTDHFRWTRSWRMKGKTATGRATIAVLGMNRPAIVAIRQQLARIGLFPPWLLRG